MLYEMLTGRRPFEGEDVTGVLARIIERDPDLAALPASTPAPIHRLLHRCLEKDRNRRLPDIGVARLDIDDALTTRHGVEATDVRQTKAVWRERLSWVAVGALAASLIAAGVFYSRDGRPESRPVVHASIPLTEPLDTWRHVPAIAIAPDGARVVYRPYGEGPLYSRLLNEPQGSVIAGTDGGVDPFFSPDGAWLAFFSGSELKKFAFAGGAVASVARLPIDVGALGNRGATWEDNGTIVFAPSTGAGLFRVPDTGGPVEPLTTLAQNETNHRWPQLLPGGKAVLFTVKTTNLQSFDDAQIVVRALNTGEQHAVAQGESGQYVDTGHIVYARGGGLYAVPFDTARLAVTGAPIKIQDGVAMHPTTGGAQFAVSRSGALVYAAGDSHIDEVPLLWIDRDGKTAPLGNRDGTYRLPRISPDGRRVALFVDAAYGKIWIIDIARGTFTRASQLGGDHLRAEWMPDSVRLAVSADVTGTGVYRIFSDRIDGAGTAAPLLDDAQSANPESWSPDGQTLLYWQSGDTTGQDVWAYSVANRKSMPFLQGAANEYSSAFSPDGRWVAYVSDESGRAEVYVRPFPGPGTRHQISTDGGIGPAWSPNGRELFFARDDTLFAIPVSVGATFTSGAVRRLLSGPYDFGSVSRNYDVSPDGQHFVAPKSPVEAAPRRLELVLNWLDELQRQAR